jgi:hypothetical protein
MNAASSVTASTGTQTAVSGQTTTQSSGKTKKLQGVPKMAILRFFQIF